MPQEKFEGPAKFKTDEELLPGEEVQFKPTDYWNTPTSELKKMTEEAGKNKNDPYTFGHDTLNEKVVEKETEGAIKEHMKAIYEQTESAAPLSKGEKPIEPMKLSEEDKAKLQAIRNRAAAEKNMKAGAELPSTKPKGFFSRFFK